MLPIFGRKRSPLCNGVSRRDVLKIGALGAGLTLTDLLRAEAALGIESSNKAVIMVYMVGAPPHQDMYDLKMDAPNEIRGEFQPIGTNVSGIQICEHLQIHFAHEQRRVRIGEHVTASLHADELRALDSLL